MLTPQELSLFRGMLGTASSRAQQMSPQLVVDLSLLLSATARPLVQDLLHPNKLVRDMRRSASQTVRFHASQGTPWQQMVFGSCADASDRPRPDDSRTGGFVSTLATEKSFGRGQEDDVSLSTHSFKLPRKIADSNNGETQARAFANENLWLARLARSGMHGAPMQRWHLDCEVSQLGGMLISDSTGIFRGFDTELVSAPTSQCSNE